MFDQLIGKRVLIIEDDYYVATALALAVEEHGGEVIGPFPVVKEALGALTIHKLDAAVLDIRLRRENTFSLARELTDRKIPFIFYTATDLEQIPPRYSNVKSLRKPARCEQALALLGSVLASAPPEQPELRP